MIDSVLVAEEQFQHLVLMGGQPREEWNDNPNAPKEQKISKDGVPVWRLQVGATPRRGRPDMLQISVASPFNPVDDIGVGTVVAFEGLTMGVAKTKSGYSVWWSADAVKPADVPAAYDRQAAKA
jgi:hypothetical protein